MIQVTLKAKHFYYIANELKNIVAGEYFGLLNRIQAATAEAQDNDEVTVATSADDIVRIFAILASKPEGQVNTLNTEMMQLFQSQMLAGIQAGDEHWMNAAQGIQAIRERNWQATEAAIEAGKNFIKQ
jgi:hypothetical protein